MTGLQLTQGRSGLVVEEIGRTRRYCSNCQSAKCMAGMRSSRPDSVGRRRVRMRAGTGCSSSGNGGIRINYKNTGFVTHPHPDRWFICISFFVDSRYEI